MKVTCSISETQDGRGITATCSRCNNETDARGTEDPSIRRALVAMREECPRRERNFYVDH